MTETYERRVMFEEVEVPSEHAGARANIYSQHGMYIDSSVVQDDGTVKIGPKYDRQTVKVEVRQ